MNNKNVIIVLAICVVILAGAVIFLALPPKATAPTNSNSSGLANNQADANQNINTSVQNQNTNNLNTIDKRQLYETAKNIPCDMALNTDSPNQQIKYSNPEYGIAITLPYNNNWGNDIYRINPYDEAKINSDNGILSIGYGYLTGFDGCMRTRQYGIMVQDKKTATQVMSDLGNSEKYDQDSYSIKPYLTSINDLPVIKYQGDHFSDQTPYLVVIGEKYNYEFSAYFYGSTFDDLENIIKTLSFI